MMLVVLIVLCLPAAAAVWQCVVMVRLRAGPQSMSHHPERPSLVVRSAESIFSPLRPGMYFVVILMAAGL